MHFWVHPVNSYRRTAVKMLTLPTIDNLKYWQPERHGNVLFERVLLLHYHIVLPSSSTDHDNSFKAIQTIPNLASLHSLDQTLSNSSSLTKFQIAKFHVLAKFRLTYLTYLPDHPDLLNSIPDATSDGIILLLVPF